MFLFLSKLLPIFIYPLGLACCLLVIALLLKQQSRWMKITISAALFTLWIGGNGWVAMALTKSLEWQYFPPEQLPKADIIVVLGGGTGPVQYPREIVELGGAADRIFYAGWLYHQGVAPRLLLTGGYLSWRGTINGSPAEDMAMILKMLGVPDDSMLLEEKSANTYENALFSKDILDREGVSQVVLVTSALHMPRSVALFENQGIEVIPAPTDYTVTQINWEKLWEFNLTQQIFYLFPTVGNLSATTSALKEYIGIWVSTLMGWI